MYVYVTKGGVLGNAMWGSENVLIFASFPITEQKLNSENIVHNSRKKISPLLFPALLIFLSCT